MTARIRTCWHCGGSLEGLRIDAFYCSEAHRKRAERRSARGLPSDFAPEGWRRGRTGLGQRTDHEQELERARKAAYREGRAAGKREGEEAGRRLARAMLQMRLAGQLILVSAGPE